MSPQRANQWVHNHKAHPSHVVVDKGQKLAAQYGATATPTVFLLGRNGKLIYKGAIDDGEKKEYLREALDEALAGKAITLPKTRSWGCGIR